MCLEKFGNNRYILYYQPLHILYEKAGKYFLLLISCHVFFVYTLSKGYLFLMNFVKLFAIAFFIHKHLLLIVLDYFLFRQYVLHSLPYTFPNGLPTWIYGEQNHFSIVYQLFLSRSLVKRMDIWFFCNILFCLPN